MLAVFPTCSSGVFPPVSPHLISLLPIFLPPAPCPLHESPSEPGVSLSQLHGGEMRPHWDRVALVCWTVHEAVCVRI